MCFNSISALATSAADWAEASAYKECYEALKPGEGIVPTGLTSR
jgi:hypothetical protein